MTNFYVLFTSSPSPQVAHRLKQAVQELGVSCVQLVQDGGKVHSDPSDSYARKVLSDNARRVPEKVHCFLIRIYCVTGSTCTSTRRQ